MFKKRGSILLALIMVFNLFTTFTPFDGSGVVFAEDDVYVYDPEGQTGDGYYFNDGTAQTGDTGLVYFNDTQKGTITVQNYDVSNIGWLSGNENLWTRNNMFDQSKARDRIQMDATLNDGYGNTPKAYDTDYVFYKTSSWNGSIEQGGMSKIARRMWGYYTPPQSGSYRFRVISDDGHYINFYLDDIFYDPKYDHYDIGTTYNEKWDRFYENGVNPVANINKDTPQSPMIVTSNVTTTLPAIQMTQGEVYPFFIEYFNWGGGGKFYFQVSLNGGPFQQVNTEHLYPEVINVPRNPNSGLDLTVENGTRTIHGYDNFNAETIDTNVWENITNFDGSNQMLLSEGGLSSIKMKGNYANYDTYKIRVDILSEGDQAEGLSIGGIGVSSGDEVWTHNLSMDQGVNNDRWYRKYGITEYGSISNSNATGNMLIAEEIVEQQDNPTDVWKNKPIRMEIDAVRLTDGTGYKVSTAFYDVNESGNTGEVIKSIVKNYLNDEFDFEEFYLTSIAPEVDWITAFDNYDFVATKYLVFDSLRVDWESNTYKLSWDLVPGATGYKVFYQTGINSSGVPIIQEFPITGTNIESIKDGYITFPDNSAYCNHPFKVIATVDGYDMSSNTVYVGGNASNLVLSGSYNDNDYTATWNDLNIVNKNLVQSYTYSLFYGDTQSTVNLPVEGAQSLSSDQLQYVFEDLQTSSKYYGKYLQLVADVVYTKGENHFYSNIIQIKSDIRIEVQHVKDQYVIGWKAENMFEKYRLFRSDDAADFASAGNIPNLTNDLILNVSSSREDNGYIYFKVADTDSTYINKAYIAGGYYANSTSPNIYSNIAATAGDVTVP
ncbi:MAG: hypothetical protein JXO44_14960, partial [Clostridia bacterium]|nr:hypothetical protein [Clostridia bacterium]